MRRGVWWTIVSLGLLVGVGLLAYWDFNNYMSSPIEMAPEGRPIKVVITRGSTLTQVTELLREREVVKSPTYFRLHLMLNELDDSVRSGAYTFVTSQTPAEVALELSRGPSTPYVTLLVREGADIWQVAQAFDDAGLAPVGEVLDLLRSEELAERAGIPRGAGNRPVLSRLEGFVFPESYFVEPGQSLERIVGRMVEQHRKEMKALKRSHIAQYSAMLEEMGLSDHEIVTLASMVEKETALPHEKKLIASVLMNRLRKQMRLQIDPTLTYTMERRGRKPTAADRKDESNPYNTYAHDGLPPGPICNPGRESLAAVVAPAKTGFLFFVAKRDGSGGHHFSTTLEEHERAITRYLKNK